MTVPDVIRELETLGSVKPAVRPAVSLPHHEGQESAEKELIMPLKTDQGFYIVDAPFPKPLVVEDVPALSAKIRNITGVLEVGIFAGEDGIDAGERIKAESKEDKGRVGGQKPVMAYFGMEDGSVQTRSRKGGVPGL
jgi:ribose 5-phosphate isomerase A